MALLYSAVPTPFGADGGVELQSFKRMLERSLAQGVDGFFVSGGMGEWSQLDREEKCRLVEAGMDTVSGRGKILMGITETGLQQTLKTLKSVSAFRPDGVVVMLPPPSMTQYGAADYLEAVLDASTLPVYYYHCPQVCGMEPSKSELIRLLKHPKLAGIKNSSANVEVRRELLLLRKEFGFILFEGDEWSIDEAISLGCDGALCGGCCLAGKLMRRVVDTAASGDFAGAQELQYKVIELFHGIYGSDGHRCRLGLKYAMQKLGVFETYHCRIKDDCTLTESEKVTLTQTMGKFANWLS